MHLLWLVLFSLFAFMVLIWLATRIAQLAVRRAAAMKFFTVRAGRNQQLSFRRFPRSRRPIIRISLEELRHLLQQDPDNFLVLDLRMSAQLPSLPDADALVLTVSPSELTEILVWLPPNRSVVFYGECSRWAAQIIASPSIQGTAPFYFLDDNFSYMEVA